MDKIKKESLVLLINQKLLLVPFEHATLTSGHGPRQAILPGIGEFHSGQDWGVPCRTPVRITNQGVVKQVGYHKKYGRFCIYECENGLTVFDCHLAAIYVCEGETVKIGQYYALSGDTGEWTTGPHLHQTVWEKNQRIPQIDTGQFLTPKETVNPMKYYRRLRT